MFVEGLKAAVVDATIGRVAEGHPEQRRTAGRRWILQPSVFGCLGLALAVFLWGYNYRLSLYHQRDLASRTMAAKLWVDQRHTTGLASLRIRVEADFHGASDALDASPRDLLDLTVASALDAVPARTRRLCFSESLLPLRSPPLSSFSA